MTTTRVVLVTRFEPAPYIDLDWVAYDNESYPACPIGWGATQEAAIASFWQQWKPRPEVADLPPVGSAQ